MKRISRMCLGRLCDWRSFRPMQDVPADTISVAESWLMKRISRMCLGRGSCWQGGVGDIPGVSTAYGRCQDISRSGVQQLLVAPGRLVRKHIAYQNLEGIAKKGKCNCCGRMVKAA